ncbi:MAG: cell division protein ZipA C-terminal FtsZ-binding domain-containing protein [Gammaproteobacteria bacterium]|tara:strand:- start:217 stop:888 length:672 start_codon:yes stop_codon:yes gene_type:complete
MSINEIIILLLGIIISITLLLMFRRLFFGKKSSIEINKKVNSRELFEPVQASEEEIVENQTPINEEILDDYDESIESDNYDSVFKSNEKTDLITIHLEAEENVFEYEPLIHFLKNSDFDFSDEGGWFKINLEEENNFLFVNGLNPGKFSLEENIISTNVMTLIYSMKPKTNSVNSLAELIKFSELVAKQFSSQILDSDRNALTQQMVEHYSQMAEEFDLNNLS